MLDFKGSWFQYLPLIEFTYNNSYQVTIGLPPYEVLYRCKYQSPLYWDNVGERQTLGPKLIQDIHDKVLFIKERMSAVQSQHKCYAKNRRWLLEFEVEDRVFFKISLIRRVVQFRKKEKLNPQFIGRFEITQRLWRLAYKVTLPPNLVGTHEVFHVST